jgi:2'-5' RNA ligase
MPEQDDFQAFLEEERRRQKQPAPSVSTAPKDDFQTFLEEERQGSAPAPEPSPEPSPTPLPRPQRQDTLTVLPTQRQEFGRRPLDLDTALTQSHRTQVGRQLASEAALARTPVTLRPDWRSPAPLGDVSDILSSPARLAALTPEERQFLQGTADYERRNLEITSPPGPKQGPPAFKPKREALKPGTTVKVGSRNPADFDASVAERNILETALDPTKASNFTADEWQDLQNAAGRIAERNQEDQFQGRISQLAAERAAQKAEAPNYPAQLANRFARGMTGTMTSAIRGASLLHPQAEEDLRRMGVLQSPEEGDEFLRRTLPVDPTDESFLAKSAEAAGSAVPFVLGSAASGAAGLPSWLAPAVLGAATNAGQTYDEAIAAGQHPEAAKRAAIVGALIGLTEAAGVGRIGGEGHAITSAARRALLPELLKSATMEFGEESVQEAFSQLLNNVNAKILSGYDPKRAITEGVGESGLLGGLVGLGFGGGLHAAGATAEGVGRLRERVAERAAGAEAVRSEQFAPLDLTPTSVGPTNLISLREAAQPEFRKRLEEATAPSAEAAPALASPEAATTPAEAVAAPAEAAPADPVAAAVQQLMSLRRPTAEETKQAEKQAKEQKKEAEKQAKQQQKDDEKQAKERQKEEEKQSRLDDQTTEAAKGEIRRMRLYDESVSAARAASEEAESLIHSGDYPGAIGKLRAQQNALGQSVKYLPETPEAVQTRANVAAIVEGIGQRIPDLRKQSLATQQGAPKTEAVTKPSKTEQADQERRQRAETGERLAQRYRAEARQKYDAGDLLGAHAAYRASLQALNDVMKITPPAEVGRRTQLRNAITAVENDLSGVSGELKKGKARTAKAVDENAPTRELPSNQAATPLLETVNNPEGGVPPRTEPLSGIFGRLARNQESARGEAQDNVRLVSRIRQLGGINPAGVYTGDLQSAVDKKYPGLINRKDGVKPDTLIEYLAEEGYPVDREDLDSLFRAIDDDVAGKAVYPITRGRTKELEREEAEYYANLPSEPLEAPESAAAQPAQEETPTQDRAGEFTAGVNPETPARLRTERLPVSTATPDNIESLRARRDELSRLRFDRGELPEDLADEYRELGGEIIRFENEQAKVERGGERDLAPPAGGDERPYAAPSREDRARAFAAAEARLEEESKRAAGVLPRSDTETLDRGIAAVDALFADINEDVDALDLLDRAIEGDADAEAELTAYAERQHGIDADTVGSILDARRAGRERERGRIRQIAQARAGESRTEAGAPGYGENGEAQPSGPQARELSAQDLETLNQNPEEIADEDFDGHLQSLEALNNDRIHGLVEMPEWAMRQLEARLKQANEIRRGLVKEKRLGPKNEPLPAKGKALSKKEAAGKIAEQSRLARAIGKSAEDQGKVKVADLGLESKTPPARPESAVTTERNINIDDISLGRDDLSKGRMFQAREALREGVKPEKKGVPLREQIEPIEVVPDPDAASKWIVDNDGNHRVALLKLQGFQGDVPVKAWEAPAKQEAPTVVHSNPEIDRKPILAETNRGTVLVANPNNKTGVSEVKDRSGEPSEYKFSSTQVNLPKDVADQITAFAKRISDKDLAEDGREDEPHITLKYGLHGADPKFVQEALAGEGPIKVKFGKVSLFENPDFDVVKVDVDSPDLHRLNKKVAESQPVTDTHPEYKPHATIAYLKKGKGEKYAGNNFLEGKTVTLDHVTFSGRDGDRVEIPLTGKQSTGAIPAGAMPELNEPGAPPSPLERMGKEPPLRGRQSYEIPETAVPELREEPKKASGGGHYMGFGLGSLQPLFNRPATPKTTPLRQIADALGHEALKIDASSIADEAIDALAAAVSRGKTGSLPFARAVYWADKLKAKKVAGYLKNRQVAFITQATNLVQEVAKQSVAMDNAKRGSLAWEKARKDLDRARVKLSNHLSKAGEYDHPLQYAAKGYKASLLSAPHIPFFNILAQVAQFPFHEAQRSIDFLVPSKVFNKWGIPYDKPPADIRTWAPAMAREMGAIAGGAKSSFGDIIDMLRYGVTESGLNAEAAQRLKGAPGGGTDKYELGNRPRLIPGLDQAIMAVGRIQGAADVPFFNVIYATALAAEADATARKIARDHPQLKLTKDQIKDLARDLAHEPSAAMIAAAADEANRFKLDYPTWGYELLQKARDLEAIKKGGRHVEAAWKAAFDFIVPFSKIPLAAVDTALLRYSPAGFARVGSRLVEARKAKAKGKQYTGRYSTPEAFGRDTVELYRQSIVGTLAWVTLGLLGSMGYAAFTGGSQDDKRKDIGAVREIQGERFTPEMSVGGQAFDLGKLGPVGQAASMGARVAAAAERRYDKEAQDLEGRDKQAMRVLAAAKKGLLLDNPIGRAMTDISDEGGEEGFIRGKIRGIVPGALRDVARMTDETKRIPEDNSILGKIRGDIQSGLPSLRNRMQPRLNALGQPVEETSPFSFMRSLRPGAQLEDMRSLGVGLSMPKREADETAKEYNQRVKERGEQFKETLGGLREDETMRSASPDARRAVYEQSLKPQAMERAGKLSDGSVRIERQIEALRGDAYAALRSMPEYRTLSAKDQKAVRELVDEELERFRARALSVDQRGRLRREKPAQIPDWTPADLVKAAMEARQ